MYHFKIVSDLGDSAELECICGEIFYCSPCGGDCVTWDKEKKCLVPKCPACGKTEDELK